ncbi:MAG: S9 family peptidase [Thermoanaerobaculaceae bacterium]|jgi:dipeptidyl aminopeptidase/acylaminoacyl peptidase
MTRKTLSGLVAIVIVLGAAALAQGELPPLIPREVLFGNPVKAAPQISPDGTRLSFLAPSPEGVLNVWVRTIGKDDDAQVTRDTHRGIRTHFWAQDGKHLLYQQDVGGDENFHVYSVDLGSNVIRDMTPFAGIRAEGVILDRKHPNEMLVGLNLRDRRVFDIYRVDLTTGAVLPDTVNPGDVVAWQTDPDFEIRGAMARNPKDGSTILRVRDRRDAPWRDLVVWPFGENGGVEDFTADGKALFVESSIGSDTTRLVKVDAATGKELETIASNPRCDVSGVLVQPDTHEVQAVTFNYLKTEWRAIDPNLRDDLAAIGAIHRGVFAIQSRDAADRNWVVAFSSDNGPVAWYAYHRDTHKADFLFVNQPELEKAGLAAMEPVVIKARDGYELVAYLTLPVGIEAHNLPLVLNVHGGPWGRDNWGFRPDVQWFANRGYACLQVNFRGSTGFGKKFLNAGNGQWGVGSMQDDLTDAVRWAIGKGIADPKRVCIYGGSYGGYATLAGLAFTPELYACGVDIVGPSHIKTLFASIPPYWAPIKSEFLLRVGDPEKDDALDRRISPLFHVDAIRAPLLIGQGANDPRVNINESNQIVEAMRARKLPVTYIVYADEGHGFARPANRLDFNGRTEEFLARYLGGRAEPWREVKGSAAEVK